MIIKCLLFQFLQNGIRVFFTGLQDVANDEYWRFCVSRDFYNVLHYQFRVAKSGFFTVAVRCKRIPRTTAEYAIVDAATAS